MQEIPCGCSAATEDCSFVWQFGDAFWNYCRLIASSLEVTVTCLLLICGGLPIVGLTTLLVPRCIASVGARLRVLSNGSLEVAKPDRDLVLE